jgi:hypothetical protein
VPSLPKRNHELHLLRQSAENGLEMKKARGRTRLSTTGHSANALIVPKNAMKDVALEQLRLILSQAQN